MQVGLRESIPVMVTVLLLVILGPGLATSIADLGSEVGDG